MSDRQQYKRHKPQSVDTADTHDEIAHPVSTDRFRYSGALPPVMEGFRDPGPTASDLAYGRIREWQKKGNACEVAPPTAPANECYMSDAERRKTADRFQTYVSRARENYKSALVQEKVELLLQKEEEVSSIGLMLVSLAGGHIVAHLTAGLIAAKQNVLLRNARYDESPAERLLSAATDDRLKLWTTTAFERVKSPLTKPVATPTDGLNPNASEKKQGVSFIDALQVHIDFAFEEFEASVLNGSDAELEAAHEAMSTQHHTVDIYKALVRTKVDAFKKSGVMDVGHKNVPDRRHDGMLHMDTRVVHVTRAHGTELWYEKQTTLDAGFGTGPSGWSPASDRRLDRRVPDEFAGIALARSEAHWGPTVTIEDPAIAWMRQHGADPTKKPLPANSVFARQPEPVLGPSKQDLPSGSVFADHAQQQGPGGPSVNASTGTS